VRAIVRMARDLGVDAVAEGVETGEQRESLRGLARESMQGYCFSHPLAAEEAGRMLSPPLGRSE